MDEALKLMVDDIRKMYTQSKGIDKMHAIIIGEKGAGKTSLAKTCPLPIFIDCWDPGGSTVLKAMIEKGDVVVDNRWEKASPSEPLVDVWERTYNERGRAGFFGMFGTYILDSTTTFGQALTWQLMKKEGRSLPDMHTKLDEKKQGMRIQDWGGYLNFFTMITRSMGALPCNTLLLGHVGRDVDENTMQYLRSIMLPGSSKNYVPINMPEMYVLKTRQSASGVQRVLLTENDGEYLATTRMGGEGKLKKEEEPNIKAMLRKCGFSCEDKPKLV